MGNQLEFPKGINLKESETEIPEKVKKWVLGNVVKNTYLMYQKRKNKVWCTKCGATYDVQHFENMGIKVSHGSMHGICESCGHSAMFRSAGLGRECLTESFRLLYFLAKGQDIYSLLWEVDISFREDMPRVHGFLIDVKKFGKGENVSCRRSSYWRPTSFVQVNSMRFPPVGSTMGYFVPRYSEIALYDQNLHKVFRKSGVLKYASVEKVFRNDGALKIGEEDLVNYMDLFTQYRSIELLLKAGFTNLVEQKVTREFRGRSVNWRGSSLPKILKMNKAQMREVRKANLGCAGLDLYQKCLKHSPGMMEPESDESAAYWILNASVHKSGEWRKPIEVFTGYMRPSQLVSYMKSQKEKDMHYSDYLDYLDEAQRLGWDLTRKRVLFPKNLQAAHRKSNKLLNKLKDEIIEKEFSASIYKITKMKEPYEAEGLLIRPAKDPAELRMEGTALGHCVSSYARKVSEGHCAILLIRKASRPNTPYYTLELSPHGKVVQCRGKSNRATTPEIDLFIKEWQQWRKQHGQKKKVAIRAKAQTELVPVYA